MEKLKELFRKMNDLGIPLPFARDPKTGKSSVTLSLMLISFITVLGGQLSKFSKLFGDIDMSSAMGLFIATSALYLGRKLQNDGKNVVTEQKPEEGKSNE